MVNGRVRGMGLAAAPGTCGELVQGRLAADATPFLVTLPVDLFSRVLVVLGEDEEGEVRWSKARLATALTLEYFGVNCPFRVRVSSAIPVGKGMASSTADVVAASLAAARALGRNLSPKQLATLALKVEPSDGLMYPGMTMFDHLGGTRAGTLGYMACRLLPVDLGGEVDTVTFNAREDVGALERARGKWAALALEMVESGIADGDLDRFGRGATLSAMSHQEILPQGGLEEIWRWGREGGAVGVCAAHSGTVVGVIFPLEGAIPMYPRELPGQPLPVVRSWGGGVI